MGKRYGRNQKRRDKAKILKLESQVRTVADTAVSSHLRLVEAYKKVRELEDHIRRWTAHITERLGAYHELMPHTPHVNVQRFGAAFSIAPTWQSNPDSIVGNASAAVQTLNSYLECLSRTDMNTLVQRTRLIIHDGSGRERFLAHDIGLEWASDWQVREVQDMIAREVSRSLADYVRSDKPI